MGTFPGMVHPVATEAQHQHKMQWSLCMHCMANFQHCVRKFRTP